MRAEDLPLVLPVLGSGDLPRGARVRVKLGTIDEIALDVHGTVIERLDAPETSLATSPDGGEDNGDEELVAGPIAIAVDVSEEPSAADNRAP